MSNYMENICYIIFIIIFMYKDFATNITNIYNYNSEYSKMKYIDGNTKLTNYFIITLPGWSINRQENGELYYMTPSYGDYIPYYKSKKQLSKRFNLNKIIKIQEKDKCLVLYVQ